MPCCEHASRPGLSRARGRDARDLLGATDALHPLSSLSQVLHNDVNAAYH
jgi:hypothetical protein